MASISIGMVRVRTTIDRIAAIENAGGQMVRWNPTAGVLGALGGVASFVSTTTIIPFMPDGWAASAGGFPAMTERVAFLMKDFVLLAVSLYLLKQDLLTLSLQYRETSPSAATPTDMPTAGNTLRRVV
jgi:uncharacterized membrane protein YkgB